MKAMLIALAGAPCVGLGHCQFCSPLRGSVAGAGALLPACPECIVLSKSYSAPLGSVQKFWIPRLAVVAISSKAHCNLPISGKTEHCNAIRCSASCWLMKKNGNA
jgi:hypothetical protein